MNETLLWSGIVQLRLGLPEEQTPVTLRASPPANEALDAWRVTKPCPVSLDAITGRATARGYEVTIPLADDEQLYGFGLQMHSLTQRGKKKTLRVNSDPVADTGDSHAPVPFYVSTHGYAVFVDTARYAVFYNGSARRVQRGITDTSDTTVARSADDLYRRADAGESAPVTVEIRGVTGVDVYIFWGDSLQEAVQRYNLFSGGGCLPPTWGLGVWYRVRSDFTQAQVEAFATTLRNDRIPCDVLGLEPGWQSHAYPCSFVWGSRFPDPKSLAQTLAALGYRLNLWTHIFTHPNSPLYDTFLPLSGDYSAFGGLVPDLSLPEARQQLAAQHEAAHIAVGVAGYKLDECDNSDFTAQSWSFPEMTRFPSGMDGEQMHQLLGVLYQSTVQDIFRRRNERTYGMARSSGGLSAASAFVLYSDLYDHRAFIRALVNSGFSGLLWTPEVRDATGAEDLIRRVQTVVFSPQALVNGWYIQHPPWKQWDTDSNNLGQFAPDSASVEAVCRSWFELRMRLIPYLYAAFARYFETGAPPFRAIVMDYPDDAIAHGVDDAYLVGEALLVAPVIAGETGRDVYLPEGDWHDFWTGKPFAGGRTVYCAAPWETIPVFVRSGTLLPLANATLHTGDPDARELAVYVYGAGNRPATLWEDDGHTENYRRGERCRMQLTWDGAAGHMSRLDPDALVAPQNRYRIREWITAGVGAASPMGEIAS